MRHAWCVLFLIALKGSPSSADIVARLTGTLQGEADIFGLNGSPVEVRWIANSAPSSVRWETFEPGSSSTTTEYSIVAASVVMGGSTLLAGTHDLLSDETNRPSLFVVNDHEQSSPLLYDSDAFGFSGAVFRVTPPDFPIPVHLVLLPGWIRTGGVETFGQEPGVAVPFPWPIDESTVERQPPGPGFEFAPSAILSLPETAVASLYTLSRPRFTAVPEAPSLLLATLSLWVGCVGTRGRHRPV
jgi:hypothetical protein